MIPPRVASRSRSFGSAVDPGGRISRSSSKAWRAGSDLARPGPIEPTTTPWIRWEATVPVMIVGVVGALIAALPGLIDLFKVAEPQGAFKIGVAHAIINLVVVGIFTVNFVVRLATETAVVGIPWEFWLSVAGVGLLAVSGALGWHMVYRYHVGVEEEPHELTKRRKTEFEERATGAEPRRDVAEGGTPA